MSVRSKKNRAGEVIGYQARYLDRSTGKQPSRTFRTREQALAWEAEQRGRVYRRIDHRPDAMSAMAMVRGSCTVVELVEMWAKEAGTPSTRGQREHLAKNLGALEDEAAIDVQVSHVIKWRESLRAGRTTGRKSGLAESTIRTMTRQLRAAFAVAVERGYADENPVATITSKRIKSKAIMPEDILTVTEIKSMVEAWDDPIKTMIQLGATSGLRIGEIAGLRTKNVELRTGKVHVVEQAAGGREWKWGPLKSSSAQRIVSVPPSTVTLIENYRSGVERRKDDPLFQTETGAMWNASNAGRVILSLIHI